MNIGKYIKELVIRNECIVLAGFGGFETYYKPAFHDRVSGKFIPPSKNIIFMPEFTVDNGILMNYIAEKEKIELNEAQSIVDEYIQSIVNQIDLNGLFIIENFGKLIKKNDGKFEFHKLDEEIYLIDSFGLSEVILPESDIKEEILSVDTAPETPAEVKKSGNIKLLIAIILIIISGLFFLLIKFNLADGVKDFINDRNSVKNEAKHKIVFGQRQSPAYRDSLAVRINEKLEEKTGKEKALYYKEPEIKPVVETEISKPANFSEEKKYVIVAGSFVKESLATDLANTLNRRGYNPFIIKSDNGFFRVILETCEDIDLAIQQLEKYKKNLDNSVWILRI